MKSFAKINTFLKVTGTRGEYHEILSRFVLIEDLYDEIWFEKSDKFYMQSQTQIKNNIILKAKKMLEDAGYKNEIDEFFKSHKIVLKKSIPIGGGLGGGSSNAATFLKLVNKELNLNIKDETIYKIGKSIGSDVAFFLSGYKSANVSGVGEIVEEFTDDMPNINLIFPKVFCKTPDVYRCFRKNFMHQIDVNNAKDFKNLTSKELLSKYKNSQLNDLLNPCFELYPQLKKYNDKFLSGSGSTLFELSE